MIEFGEQRVGVEYTERHGAFGIAIRDGHVLIEMAEALFLPGGGVDPGETIEEALRREFLEETGYELTAFTPIGSAVQYVEILEENAFWKRIDHFFIVELGAKGEPTYADGHICPVEWLDIEEAKGNMFLQSQGWGIEQALADRRL
jgi:8-oxo-dGTP diphosphatase